MTVHFFIIPQNAACGQSGQGRGIPLSLMSDKFTPRANERKVVGVTGKPAVMFNIKQNDGCDV
jgi:hypothetical protein